jgi:CMP-N-acetylneuraminic acid synthetase
MHTAKSLKNNKIITSYFHTTKQKKNHFVFVATQFLTHILINFQKKIKKGKKQ